jgi:hypothetical protein
MIFCEKLLLRHVFGRLLIFLLLTMAVCGSERGVGGGGDLPAASSVIWRRVWRGSPTFDLISGENEHARLDSAAEIEHLLLDDDDASEENDAMHHKRSPDLAQILGASRKVQFFIKNRHLQILPDGRVNGTYDDLSDLTVFQRATFGLGVLQVRPATEFCAFCGYFRFCSFALDHF